MLFPPTSTPLVDRSLLIDAVIPQGQKSLRFEQMLTVVRRIFYTAPNLRDVHSSSRARVLLRLQSALVREDASLCTGLELNNFHVFTKPNIEGFFDQQLHATVQQVALRLGYDAACEHQRFQCAQEQYRASGNEQAYEDAAKRFFYEFLRPIYIELRHLGYSHDQLIG